MRIALLQPADVQQYRELMLEAYELAADAFTSTAEERAAEPTSYWVKRIADPSGLSAAFGAFDGQKLIGTVALEFSAKPKTKHKALVIGMYVAPAARVDHLFAFSGSDSHWFFTQHVNAGFRGPDRILGVL